MLSISRMKTLISPTLSFFSPHISKHSSIPLSFPKSIFNYPRHQILENSYLYTLQPKSCIPKSPSCSLQRRTLKMASSHLSSGEIHVIVGPMFAGKTTTLLRRIEQESSSGSLQVDHGKDFYQLDKTLRGLCYSGRLIEAIRLLCANGQQVEAATYALLLQECIHCKAYERGKIIHTQMIVVGHIPNEYLKTKLLILYAKLADVETASILFDRLMDKSLISWNAMIAGYVQKGNEEIGLNLYYEMRWNSLIPDHYTFASLFRACAALATLEHGKRAHCVMIKSQIKENVVVTSALVDMYFKCCNLSDGHKVFNESHERNTVTWTALISGYGLHGKVVEVLESFHKMINDVFQPNYVTFLAVLSACSHGGLVDEGWKYFYSMTRDYGILPRGPHYAAMVDLLGRAGRLEEAYDFILSSPSKEHPVIWGALLGACRTHGDKDLVKFAARKYFQLEPENAGKYVVLSNAFAAFGLWDNVAEVRGVMKELGMVKEPGYSRIEVQNEVYFFCKGDKSHRCTEEIYEMIKNITCTLKYLGYAPDLSPE